MRAYNKVQSPAMMVVMVSDFSVPAFGGVLGPRAEGDADHFGRRDAFDSGSHADKPGAGGDNVVPWRGRKSPAPPVEVPPL